MAAKKAGLKKVRREEWRVRLKKLAKENPLGHPSQQMNRIGLGRHVVI